MLDAVRLARRDGSADRVPLIGFAGAPWTLHELHGRRVGDQVVQPSRSGSWWSTRASAHALLERLPTPVGRFLVAQVAGGCAGACSSSTRGPARSGPRDFREVLHCPIWRRRCALAERRGAPVIAFAPGAGWASRRSRT